MALSDGLLAPMLLTVLAALFLLLWQLRRDVRRQRRVDPDRLAATMGETLSDLGLDETVARVETHASELKDFHADIERMLQHPRERGEFGEQQLDVILSDHLPPEMYGIREQVVDGTTPDCHIESSSGLICIDSKFPLENYRNYVEADDERARERYRSDFRRDVESQLEKIATDYVRPAEGTAEFAFAFVPSEAVYYHLVSEEYDLLREYAGRGVQVVSPLTMGQKLELIKADVQARQLTEQAAEVRDRLDRLGERFDAVENEWSTLYRHVQNANTKAEDVDRAFEDLQAEFDRVDRPTLEE